MGIHKDGSHNWAARGWEPHSLRGCEVKGREERGLVYSCLWCQQSTTIGLWLELGVIPRKKTMGVIPWSPKATSHSHLHRLALFTAGSALCFFESDSLCSRCPLTAPHTLPSWDMSTLLSPKLAAIRH